MNGIHKTASAIAALLASFLISLAALAQDQKPEVDISINKHDNWYSQPWIWIVGAAIFILLLVALLRGNNARD